TPRGVNGGGRMAVLKAWWTDLYQQAAAGTGVRGAVRRDALRRVKTDGLCIIYCVLDIIFDDLSPRNSHPPVPSPSFGPGFRIRKWLVFAWVIHIQESSKMVETR